MLDWIRALSVGGDGPPTGGNEKKKYGERRTVQGKETNRYKKVHIWFLFYDSGGSLIYLRGEPVPLRFLCIF